MTSRFGNIKDEDLTHWCVSDHVAKSTILACSKDCPLSDCHLTAREIGSTMMGTSRYYNKQGECIEENCNHRNTYVSCRECWRCWEVSQSGEENIKVTERFRKIK